MFMTNTQFALETVNYEIAKNVPHFEQQEKEPIEEHEEPVQPIRERQQPRQPINNPKPTKNLGSSRNVTTAQINKCIDLGDTGREHLLEAHLLK